MKVVEEIPIDFSEINSSQMLTIIQHITEQIAVSGSLTATKTPALATTATAITTTTTTTTATAAINGISFWIGVLFTYHYQSG